MNFEAPENVELRDVSFDVSQGRGWLNSAAFRNRLFITETCDVSHPPMFWLNAVAPLNRLVIVVTEAVDQFPIA